MNKTFFASDNLLVPINEVDPRTLGDQFPNFYRNYILVKAHPGVNAEDIVSEVRDIEDSNDIIISERPLTTTLTETGDYVVALTYKGFIELVNKIEGKARRSEQYQAVADELIYWRNNKS